MKDRQIEAQWRHKSGNTRNNPYIKPSSGIKINLLADTKSSIPERQQKVKG